MSLALATKGVLPDFTGTGTGTGPSTTIYVLENFDVEVTHESLEIEVTVLEDITLDVSEIAIEVDVDEEESAFVSVADSDIVDISIEIGGIVIVEQERIYYSLWDDNTIPSNYSEEIDHVELGVKFGSTVGGYITAIRFYKNVLNTSLHIGSLWTIDGQNLGSVVFTNETASGWQEMDFPAPIPIDANTIYVASYHTQGYYSYNFGYFEFAYENLPLSCPSSGESGGNGVFTYDSVISFPVNSFNYGNYWIDVKFTQQL